MRFPVEKYEDESGACQQRVKLPITRSNVQSRLVFRVWQMKSRISSKKSAKPCAFWSRRFSSPAKLAIPAVFGTEESIKHKFLVFQVYRFQCWYQSNTPLVTPTDYKQLIENVTIQILCFRYRWTDIQHINQHHTE